MAWSYWAALCRWNVDDHVGRVWSRIAYSTRYGHISLAEALTLDTVDLLRFNDALAEIVEQENTPRKG